MTLIDDIRAKVAADRFEFSEHAVTQMLVRQISVQETREVFAVATIIEDYPHDKYGPSVLVLGFTRQQRPLHIQCTYPSRPLLRIITTYQPDAERWIDNRTRRTP
jgi:hypothetical protein